MAPDRRGVVDAIREAARLAVEAASLRAVARDIGMSPMGLKHFLAGTRPYSATLRKLTAWYVVYQSEAGGYSIETVRGALSVLTEALPAPGRRRAVTGILDAVARIHADFATRPPEWLTLLRAEPPEGE